MVYHVFNRSIAGFVVFNNDFEFRRMFDLLCYYQTKKPLISFSKFSQLKKYESDACANTVTLPVQRESLVEIIGYCIMPTHFHLILKELKDGGLPIFVSNILNSYTKYFNFKHKRKGPLWEGRTQKILVKSDDQLIHLTRYVHLNPVTAYLVDKPEKWLYSSYAEYISNISKDNKICDYDDSLYIEPDIYKKFVEDRISYQRELAKIKELLIE